MDIGEIQGLLALLNDPLAPHFIPGTYAKNRGGCAQSDLTIYDGSAWRREQVSFWVSGPDNRPLNAVLIRPAELAGSCLRAEMRRRLQVLIGDDHFHGAYHEQDLLALVEREGAELVRSWYLSLRETYH